MNSKIGFELNGFEVYSGYKRTFITKTESIDYSDGQIEDEIFNVLNELYKCRDEKYQYLESQIKDWPTKYHFSWERQNILRPIKFCKTDNVLELGAGTGVLTDYIVQNVAYVCSIEGTFSRGRCIEKRCFEFENFDVLIADFLKIDLINLFSNIKFDKIVLIGVLEYVSKYSNKTAKEAIDDILKVCGQLLSQDGELIIAIENKLGLKYFLGWKEDHNGQKYYSVESKYKFKDDFATFSKKELEKKLNIAGFENVNFSYPFPDYKLPAVIVHESKYIYRKKIKQLLNNLLYEIKVPDYDLKNTNNEVNNVKFGRVLKNIIYEELLGVTSNSFLIVSKKLQKRSDILTIASYFSVQRRYEFANQITFKFQSKKIILEKKWFSESKNKISEILSLKKNGLEVQEYIIGDSLHVKLDILFFNNNKEAYIFLLSKWCDFLDKKIGEYNDNFDVVPQNAILTQDNEIKLIDVDEWEIGNKLNKAQLVYRYFLVNSKHLSWLYPENISFEEQFSQLLKDFKIDFNDWTEFYMVDNLHKFSSSNIMRKSYSVAPIFNKAKVDITAKQAFKILLKKIKVKFLKLVYGRE